MSIPDGASGPNLAATLGKYWIMSASLGVGYMYLVFALNSMRKVWNILGKRNTYV